jgi:sulfur transfer protein SufE/stress-induced morphogen
LLLLLVAALVVVVALLPPAASAFRQVVAPPPAGPRSLALSSSSLPSSSASSAPPPPAAADSSGGGGDPLGLTPELRRISDAFASVGDDKLRYKQLLHMAGRLPAMDESLKVPENKVPGCLSTVHVHAAAAFAGDDDDEPRIEYAGDSDGLLTKGLVALLVRGLSGCTAGQIQAVNPAFIREAGIGASLTPGRNNGFLNMLAAMKRKAKEAERRALDARRAKIDQVGPGQDEPSSQQPSTRSGAGSSEAGSRRPKYDAMVAALQRELRPVRLELADRSHEHAGHAGSKGLEGGESHFDLYVVSGAFEGLNVVKRHRLVYSALAGVMPAVHALQIRAQTPAEAGLM